MSKFDWIKGSFQYAMKEVVYVISVIIMVIISLLDLFTKLNLTGGYGFFTLILASAVFNIGYLKWLHNQETKV